jgi:cyanophycinase
VTRIQPIAPDEGGELDLEYAATIIRSATGLFVGGGHTPTYQRLYAEPPLGPLLRQRYVSGVPYAGLSAGAMIALDPCVLAPEETQQGRLELAPGLGLLTGCLMEPHFTELNALPNLLESMARARIGTGWGVDEPACAVFEDDVFAGVLGRSVTRVTMTSFESRTYSLHLEITPYPIPEASS